MRTQIRLASSVRRTAEVSCLMRSAKCRPILQPKLLRVLQEKVYYRVGSDKPQEADFRLICSTNRDPFDSIKDGNLREDLYYRINTIEITIPPLRERMEDVPMLAEHFLHMYGEKYKKPTVQFSQNAYNQMLNYNWRGNVRELEHAIERAVLLSRNGKIESMDLLQANGSAVSGEFPAMEFAAAAAAAGEPMRVRSLSALPSMMDLEGEELFEEIGRFIVERLSEPVGGSRAEGCLQRYRERCRARRSETYAWQQAGSRKSCWDSTGRGCME